MSQKSVRFHIKSNDYFGTLATVLSLFRQSEANNIKISSAQVLEKIENDLMFLQKNYKITKL